MTHYSEKNLDPSMEKEQNKMKNAFLEDFYYGRRRLLHRRWNHCEINPLVYK
jgi:hypothetical protein